MFCLAGSPMHPPPPRRTSQCEVSPAPPSPRPPRMVVALLRRPEHIPDPVALGDGHALPTPSGSGSPRGTLRTGRRPAAGGSPASVRPSTRPRGAWGSPWPRRAARRGCGLSGSGWRGWGRWREALGREQCQETVCGTGEARGPPPFDPPQEAGERRWEKLPLGNSHGLPKFGWWAFAHPRGWRPLTTCPGRDLRAVTAPSAWPRPGPSTASTHRMGEWESRPERPAQRF